MSGSPRAFRPRLIFSPPRQNSMAATNSSADAPEFMISESMLANDVFSELDFNEYFGIVSNEDLVIIRPYADDDDDKILEEIRPKFVVMYDPDPAFVRRLEVSPLSQRLDSLLNWHHSTTSRPIELLTAISPSASTSSRTRTRSRSSVI